MIRHALQLRRHVIEAVDVAEVPRDRRLREDHVKAGVPDLAVLLVDRGVAFDHRGADVGIPFPQTPDRAFDGDLDLLGQLDDAARMRIQFRLQDRPVGDVRGGWRRLAHPNLPVM